MLSAIYIWGLTYISGEGSILFSYTYFDSPSSLLFSPTIILHRAFMSKSDKLKYSQSVPAWFDGVMCGMMLGDGNLRMQGTQALMSVQQTHQELVEGLWQMCFDLHLVINPVGSMHRNSAHKVMYYFQSLTMPYFTTYYNNWYRVHPESGKRFKVVPNNVGELLTPIALAFWLMGDGSFDGHGRGAGRVSLHTNCFTLDEVKLLQAALLNNFGIESSLHNIRNSDPSRGHIIRIPARSLPAIRSVCTPHMYPSLMYKLGL